MNRVLSLRARLTAVILAPLLVIAALVGIWAYADAQARAIDRFDRSLLSTALSISRDTAVTGGDALSEATRDLLRDTSGGAVFYHVYAPDGVFVTGYATPPVVPGTAGGDVPEQTYYEAIYRGEPVRALRFRQLMSIDQLTGPFTFTVWQNTSLLDGFVDGRTRPTFAIIALLLSALAVIVWFGVRLGLLPLDDLENAIEQRSPDDLSPIKRKIPQEVAGIVARLNALLEQLRLTLDAKDRFISDATHQLRNPIAGVLSLAEAVETAKTPADMRARSADLVEAARRSAALADSLLALERARAGHRGASFGTFDPRAVLLGIAAGFQKQSDAKGIVFDVEIPPTLPNLTGDALMFEQAVLNLLNNALAHGGGGLTEIALTASHGYNRLKVTVSDDGKGISQSDIDTAMARFGQVEPSQGSGLGLSIVNAVSEAFGGTTTSSTSAAAFSVSMSLPISDHSTHPRPILAL
ncbi:sensor histidine kinase [Jannaschia donghaensis]|uniref:histidine kinase n=1 Tax=Jannaschia donghaensis TaxID=420998 RepID=A0A0M6YGE9_9RHOB|nr:sensor histidine kinase [Jannaschia donghaensis]CTQ49432.1 Alkaline phosphatase synthesis sensor protein PhoR [Jannaschia donghaensis]